MKTFRIFVDGTDGTQLFKNSIVKNPAHGKVKVSFSKQEKQTIYFGDKAKIEFDDSKQNIVCVAIAPEVPIYREHPQIGKHNVVFFASDIEHMAYTYGKHGLWNELTFNHEDKQPVKSATMYLSYIIDRKHGLTAPEAFSAEPDGTWLLGYHFDDKAEYEYARDNFTGWSVEGDFYLQEIKTHNKMSKQKSKGFLAKLSALFAAMEFASVTTTDGTVLEYEGETLEVGTAVFVTDADGNQTPAPDGEHTLEDGTVIVVASGVVETLTAPSSEEMEEETAEMFAKILVSQDTQLKAQAATIKTLTERVEKLEKTPPVKPDKNKFNREEGATNSAVNHLLRNVKKD